MLHHQLPSAVIAICLFLLDFALFLLPGITLTSVISIRRRIASSHVVICVIAISATLGYVFFWIFFFTTLPGKVFAVIVYLLSASVFIPAVGRRTAFKATIKRISEPILYATLAGLCYICFFFLFVNPLMTGASHADERFFDQGRPGDNIIPLIFAEKVYGHRPLRPFCCGDWLSSDRPPLQSGIFLLQRPLRLVGNVSLNYELLATGLQCLWICGIWCLLQSLETPNVHIRQILGLLVFSGFLFYNSVYTWPKLLAAACILFALSILFDVIRATRPIVSFETALATTCLGLALMAHPGSIFSMPAVAFVILYFRRLFPLRQMLFAVLILCAFGLPWMAYRKFVDPPGNRLLKMHLAGEFAINSRSTWESIKDAYSSRTPEEIVRLKWSNIALLPGHKILDTFGLSDFSFRGRPHINRAATERSRIAQREWIWNAVGLVNVGWFAGLYLLLTRRSHKPAVRFSGWLIIMALGNLLFWALVTFGPNETVTTHSSYADILLLSIGLIGFVLVLPRFVYITLLTLQLFNFFVVWVWSPPKTVGLVPHGVTVPSLQLPLLIIGVIVVITISWRALGEST